MDRDDTQASNDPILEPPWVVRAKRRSRLKVALWRTRDRLNILARVTGTWLYRALKAAGRFLIHHPLSLPLLVLIVWAWIDAKIPRLRILSFESPSVTALPLNGSTVARHLSERIQELRLATQRELPAAPFPLHSSHNILKLRSCSLSRGSSRPHKATDPNAYEVGFDLAGPQSALNLGFGFPPIQNQDLAALKLADLPEEPWPEIGGVSIDSVLAITRRIRHAQSALNGYILTTKSGFFLEGYEERLGTIRTGEYPLNPDGFDGAVDDLAWKVLEKRLQAQWEKNRGDQNLRSALANIYLRHATDSLEKGKLRNAASELRSAAAVEPPALGRLHLAESFYIQRDVHRATELLQQLTNEEPQFADAQTIFGFVLIAQGQYGQAASRFQNAADLNPRDGLAQLNLSAALLALGKMNEAVLRLRAVLQYTRAPAELFYNLGIALACEDRLDEAAQQVAEFTKLRPDRADAYALYAIVFAGKGNIQEAVRAYRKFLEFKPSDLDRLYVVAQLLSQDDKLDEALAYFEKVLRLKPNWVDAQIATGVAFAKKKDFPKAKEHFDRAIELDPQNALARFNRARLFDDTGDVARAITEYKESAAIDAKSVLPRINACGLLARENDFSQAVKYCQEAIALNPGIAQTYVNLAFISAIQHKLDDAMSFYRKALQIDPDSWEANVGLGSVFHERQLYADAIPYYQHALRLRQNDPQVHFNLGADLAQVHRRNEAIQHYLSALALDSNYADAHYNLAVELGQRNDKGDLEKAIEHCKKAMALQPNSSQTAALCNFLARLSAK